MFNLRLLGRAVLICAFVLPYILLASSTGYSCVDSTHYAWTSPSGVTYTLQCPSKTTCVCSGDDSGYDTIEPYSCPSTCQPPTCFCGTTKPPIANPVQIVTFTVDDFLTPEGWAVLQPIFDYGHKNPDGCNASFTYFLAFDAGENSFAKQLASRNIEIADHPVHHFSWPAIDEIALGRTMSSTWSGRPENAIHGFRPPYLLNAWWILDALKALNMDYISSNLDSFVDAGNSPGNTLWPYTLDYGWRGQCYEHCDVQRKYPGVWSVPMNTLYGSDLSVGPLYMMDVNLSGDDLYNTYMANFLRHYHGNRAPFGVYTHPNYFLEDKSRIDTINRFLADISKMADVWLLSMENTIEYMKAPFPAGSTASIFPCTGTPLPRPPPPPPPPANPLPPPPPPQMPISASAPEKTNPPPVLLTPRNSNAPVRFGEAPAKSADPSTAPTPTNLKTPFVAADTDVESAATVNSIGLKFLAIVVVLVVSLS